MYDISLERSSYSASTHVILHKIHAEMTEIYCRLKIAVVIFTGAHDAF